MSNHIVIVDGAWGGHHPVYIKTFARVLLEAGYRVSVLCPDPDTMNVWVSQQLFDKSINFKAYYFVESAFRIKWSFIPFRLKSALIVLNRWLHIKRSLNEIVHSKCKPDLIFFAWLDNYLNPYIRAFFIDILFQFNWSGLYFHPRHLRIKKEKWTVTDWFYRAPENLIARSKFTCSLAVLDAGIVDKLRTQLPKKKIFIFPDFTDETPHEENYSLASEIKSKAKDRIIIGLLGSLERRKGLLTLLRIAKQSADRNWFFVFAGQWASQTFSEEEQNEIKSIIDNQVDNCFFYLERIPDDAQFNALVNGCDVIFAVYEDFPHSSNLITKAALYGKSLLVGSGGYMEEVVKQYKLGEVVPPSDIQASIAALSKLTAGCLFHERAIDMQNYCMEQSQSKLRQVMFRLIENSIG